jgi:hypothetical protein
MRPLLTAVAVALSLTLPVPVLGSHRFSDVPTSATYHDAVSWLAARSISLGCGAGLYCPEELVTRGQMALFMHRLGGALTPTVVATHEIRTEALMLENRPVICVTPADYVPPYPQWAIVRGHVSISMAIVTGAYATYVASVTHQWDGGAWSPLPEVFGMTQGIPVGRENPMAVTHTMLFELAPGRAYRFGIVLGRMSPYAGTGQPAGYRCSVHAEIRNRN